MTGQPDSPAVQTKDAGTVRLVHATFGTQPEAERAAKRMRAADYRATVRYAQFMDGTDGWLVEGFEPETEVA